MSMKIFTILTLRATMIKIMQIYQSKIESLPQLGKTQCIIISLRLFNINQIQEEEALESRNLFIKIILNQNV
jgi:hypothetical protein